VSRLARVVGIAAVGLLSMAFAALNGGQRVTLRLGFAVFYQVPLPVIVFGALILGMSAMVVVSIASDLRVRRILRERFAEEGEEEQARLWVDRNQTTLFPDDDSK
jgi:uncharacterized integral membrane protein